MQIEALEIVPYRLKLTAAVNWAGVVHESRSGLLLRLVDSNGNVGWGDAAPLPGFSPESLDETAVSLNALRGTLKGRAVRPQDAVSPDSDLHLQLDAIAAAGSLPSSARFAVDLALVDLAANALGLTIPQALDPDPEVSIHLSALLMDESPAQTLRDASRLIALGFKSFKLKVGRGRSEDEAALVRELASTILPDRSLRLDANRAWSVEEARRFAQRIASTPIDYIEEPLRDPAGLAEFWLDTGLPVALDETIQESGAAAIRGFAKAAVLKPTLVGGLMATMRLAAHARSVGVQPVLSASFESAVGLRGVAAAAASVGGGAAGLDTARWMAADVLSPRPWPVKASLIDIPPIFAATIYPVAP